MKKTFPLTLLCLLVSASCATVGGGKNLDPASREFLSQVRYIITQEERKAFLECEPSERPAYVETFWEARDPSPATEVNEFKDEYYKRIEEANVLFKQGSTPGWLQDRGRAYITLGPPDNRETYPRGRNLYGKPEEVWWYGFFPIVFYDDNWTGNYRMDPLSAQQIVEIARAQAAGGAMSPRNALEETAALVFEIKTETAAGGAVFTIEIPYRNIWLGSKDDVFQTTLSVTMEVFDPAKEKVWEFTESYEISVSRNELPDFMDKIYSIDVRADIEPGEYTLTAELENKTGGAKTKKSVSVSIEMGHRDIILFVQSHGTKEGL